MDIAIPSLCFFVVAMLYSSVGFGGGSSYIALLLLFGNTNEETRVIALVCNILVVSAATLNFSRFKLIKWSKVIPLVLVSVPFAFLGGTIRLEEDLYLKIAGVTLILIAIVMLIKKFIEIKPQSLEQHKKWIGPGIGSGIGFLSGVIGIGGGVFLAPLLYIIRWDTAKAISATASFFILANSFAGLSGQLIHLPKVDFIEIGVLGMSVVAGGFIGNYMNIRILKEQHIHLLTALLIAFVGIRILWFN